MYTSDSHIMRSTSLVLLADHFKANIYKYNVQANQLYKQVLVQTCKKCIYFAVSVIRKYTVILYAYTSCTLEGDPCTYVNVHELYRITIHLHLHVHVHVHVHIQDAHTIILKCMPSQYVYFDPLASFLTLYLASSRS